MIDRSGRKQGDRSIGAGHPVQRSPGKHTRVESRYGVGSVKAVQAEPSPDRGTHDARVTADAGLAGTGQALPYLDHIQAAFGPHDLGGVRAHTDSAAAAASTELGAKAFATGEDIAFAGAPDLHTAAHEAAHVVQQRAGVQVEGGLGKAGDAYERHADAVADRVVAGQSAAELLGPPRSGGSAAVQKKDEFKTAGLDYQGGGTFTSGREAESAIGPGSGPRLHIPPDEVAAMLDSLLSSEESKEVLDGHVKGVEQRLAYWRQTLPDFAGSATETSIVDRLAKVKAKAASASSGRSTRGVDPVKVISIMAPNEPASEATWREWLIEHKSEQDAVLAVILNKTNVITRASDGGVSDLEDPKSKYKSPLAAAILALQRESGHRDYATSLAQALWSSGSIKADDPFRQKDGWMSDLGFAVYYGSISGRLASFDAMAKKPKGQVVSAARAATSEYVEKWVSDKKSVGPGAAKIRKAFYEAVKDLVRRTKSGTIALAFADAMTDVMVANFDDPNVRDEIPDVEEDLRDILKEVGAPSRDIDEVRDEFSSSVKEKTKLMDKDIHKNSVEVRYIKLYIGIRQAVHNVGEAWIAKRTKHLREKLGDLASARTWVNRGVNVAWSACPGPAYAVPVVLVGTITDIFLDMEAAKVQKNLDAYEAQLHAILDKQTSSRLKDIAKLAQDDFSAIDAGKAPELDKTIFQDIGAIEKLYSDKLKATLG